MSIAANSYFVPDEICVVAGGRSGEDAEEFYERLRQALLQNPLGIQLGALDRPSRIIQYPLLVDPGAAQRRGCFLFTYGIGTPLVGNTPDRQREAVRWLANYINGNLTAADAGLAADPLILAATPNWFSRGTYFSYPGGGPAGAPMPSPAAPSGPGVTFGEFNFDDVALNQLVNDQRGGVVPANVLVAILDTWPIGTAIAAFQGLPATAILTAARRGIAGLPTFPAGHTLAAGTVLAPSPYPPEVESHGLFVAGIIADIAPRATFLVSRVLDKYGVGTKVTLHAALKELEKLAHPAGTPRLVVNLSLEVFPSEEMFAEALFGGFTNQLQPWRQGFRDAMVMLGALPPGAITDFRLNFHSESWVEWVTFMSLQLGLQARYVDKVLFVAAAGNEGFAWRGMQTHPEPSTPAYYDGASVLSVASLTAGNAPSSFSNRADFGLSTPNGIATLGGEVAPATATTVPVVSILGLTPPNTAIGGTGWCEWAGTSFSAAILSGVAAVTWLDNNALTPDQVVAQIIARCPDQVLDALGCRALLVDQTR